MNDRAGGLADNTASRFGEHVDRVARKKDADRDTEHVRVSQRQEVQRNRYPADSSDEQRHAPAPLNMPTNSRQRADLGCDAAAHHQWDGEQGLKEMEQNNACDGRKSKAGKSRYDPAQENRDGERRYAA